LKLRRSPEAWDGRIRKRKRSGVDSAIPTGKKKEERARPRRHRAERKGRKSGKHLELAAQNPEDILGEAKKARTEWELKERNKPLQNSGQLVVIKEGVDHRKLMTGEKVRTMQKRKSRHMEMGRGWR